MIGAISVGPSYHVGEVLRNTFVWNEAGLTGAAELSRGSVDNNIFYQNYAGESGSALRCVGGVHNPTASACNAFRMTTLVRVD